MARERQLASSYSKAKCYIGVGRFNISTFLLLAVSHLSHYLPKIWYLYRGKVSTVKMRGDGCHVTKGHVAFELGKVMDRRSGEKEPGKTNGHVALPAEATASRKRWRRTTNFEYDTRDASRSASNDAIRAAIFRLIPQHLQPRLLPLRQMTS